MRSNVVVMLLLAVVFGVAAVFLSNIWLSSQQVSASVAVSQPTTNTVVVASMPLKFGDRLSTENLREIPWSAPAIPDGGFRTVRELLDSQEGGRQVLAAFVANEPILSWKITGPGQKATLSAVIDQGMTAVSIRVNDTAGVAGFVLPGDRVNVLLTRADKGQSYVDVLLQNIRILAIDQTTDESKDNPQLVKTVTVEVSLYDAQKLTLAAGVGSLSLALRQVGDGDQVASRVTLGDLGGVSPVIPAGEVVPRPSKPMSTQIGVMRGVQLQTYDVPLSSN